jgi:hypothetical protein
MPPEETVYRPDMPDFGVYALWPEPGDNWYHPDDTAIIAELVPSNKVLMRTHYDGTYYHLRYGAKVVRVRPTMWQSVAPIDLEIGQPVEILPRYGRNDPGIGFIVDILHNLNQCHTQYFVRRSEMKIPSAFERDDLRPLEIKHQLRVGFYQHALPKSDHSLAADFLNVGSLTDDAQ